MVEVRPAATVILIRRAPEVEVLLGYRPPGGVFGGIWAFPGGALDPEDADKDRFGFVDPWRAAALRETAEEVGVFLTVPVVASDASRSGDASQRGGEWQPGSSEPGDVAEAVRVAGRRFDPSRLRFLSRWITPEFVPRRFDTHFYLAEVDPATVAAPRTAEFEALEWVPPVLAVHQHHTGTRPMIEPTAWHLELLAGSDDPWAIPSHPDPLPGPEFGLADVE